MENPRPPKHHPLYQHWKPPPKSLLLRAVPTNPKHPKTVHGATRRPPAEPPSPNTISATQQQRDHLASQNAERSFGGNLASSDVTPDGEVIRPVVGVGEGIYQLPWP